MNICQHRLFWETKRSQVHTAVRKVLECVLPLIHSFMEQTIHTQARICCSTKEKPFVGVCDVLVGILLNLRGRATIKRYGQPAKQPELLTLRIVNNGWEAGVLGSKAVVSRVM